MRAMILAAGFGTRLAPITESIPKPLLPVIGVPNIIRTIYRLKAAGISEMVVNTHWLPEMLKHRLGDGAAFGVSIAYSDEPVLLGTGGGIRQAMALLGDDTFIVINGDALFAPDYRAAVAYHKAKNALVTLLVREDSVIESFGAVGVNADGRVERLVYGGKDGRHLKNFMFAGVHIVEPQLASLLPESGCIVRSTYIPMVNRKEAILAMPTEGYFCDLGTPSRYLSANIELVTGKTRIDGIYPPESGVYLGKGVYVDARAVLGPGTVLSDGVRVMGAVHLERVVVLENAIVDMSLSDAICTSDGTVVNAIFSR